MKRILRGIILGMVVILIAIPVLAYYYGALSVVESDGNDYTSLPVIASINASQLSAYGFITSTGLDTRVLTGDGYPLPHMLADDKVLFITDLAAHETKSLVFYMGAASLSSFPIIVGYNGSFETPDDPSLELGYVMELLISGYFNAETIDVGHNILYKEDAFRVWISAEHTLKVATYNSTGDEQWEMHYNNFTTGEHTVYLVANGLAAHLYVDDLVIAKDTENLYESSLITLNNAADSLVVPYTRRTFYADGLYWAFYGGISYKTSADGVSWSNATSISLYPAYSISGYGVWWQGGNVHIAYSSPTAVVDDTVFYRMGATNSSGEITWAADWQLIPTGNYMGWATIAVDTGGYPYITYNVCPSTTTTTYITKSSTNNGTWTTAGGYPLATYSSANVNHGQAITSYPNSTKMYGIWNTAELSGHSHALQGRYYNGASWGGSNEVIWSHATNSLSAFSLIADNSDNVYFVWSVNDGNVYLRVRYADGTFSDVITVAAGASACVSYDDVKDQVYIMYKSGGSVKAAVLVGGDLVVGYTLFGASNTYLSSTPFGNHIGIMESAGSGYTYHGYLSFPWEWNDNNNNWTWMQNNVMPYADEIQLAIDGTVHLHYKPEDIIHGNTLPDISTASDNDADITWGTNIDGVTTSMGPLTSSSYQPAPGVTGGNWSPAQDVMPTTGGESITGGLGTLDDNVFYPVIWALSYLSGLLPGKDPIPIPLMWVLIASLILIIIVGVCVWKMPHQLITALVGLGLIVLFNRMGIYPWWVYLIYVPIAVSVLLYERKPAL